MVVVQFFLIAQYPLLTHYAFIYEQPQAKLLAASGLFLGFLLPGVLRRELVSAIIAPLTLLILYGIYVAGYLTWVSVAPTILIPLGLLIVFGTTLLPGKEPLVTDIGERARGPLSAEMRAYTRVVTQLWTLVFVLLL